MIPQPQTFNRRPLPVQAMPWDGSEEAAKAVVDWINLTQDVRTGPVARYHHHSKFVPAAGRGLDRLGKRIEIDKPHGVSYVFPGDWVVLDGERGFRPVDPAVFMQEYDVPSQAEVDR